MWHKGVADTVRRMFGRLLPVTLTAVLALGVGSAAAQEPAPTTTSFGDEPGALRLPEALAVAPGGDLLVGDHFSGRVQRFHDGKYVSSFGLSGQGCGRLGAIGGIAVDAKGNSYVLGHRPAARPGLRRGRRLGPLLRRPRPGPRQAPHELGQLRGVVGQRRDRGRGRLRLRRRRLQQPRAALHARRQEPQDPRQGQAEDAAGARGQGLAAPGGRRRQPPRRRADDLRALRQGDLGQDRRPPALPLRRGLRRQRWRLRRRQQPAPHRRSSTATCAASAPGAPKATATASSSSRARSRSNPMAMCWSPTPATTASRSSRRPAASSAASGSTAAPGRASPRRPTSPPTRSARSRSPTATGGSRGSTSPASATGAWAQSKSFQQSTAVVSQPQGIDFATDRSVRVAENGSVRAFADQSVSDLLDLRRARARGVRPRRRADGHHLGGRRLGRVHPRPGQPRTPSRPGSAPARRPAAARPRSPS